MTIANLNELKAEIVADLARSDVNAGSSVLDRLILQAEKYLNKRLRVREMLKDEDITADEEFEDLPEDFLDIKSVRLSDSPQNLDVLPEDAFARSSLGSAVGRPKACALVYNGEDEVYQLKFGPIPNGSYTVKLSYYAEIPPLADNESNAILEDHPDLYLNGCLYFAFKKYRNFDVADRYKQYLDDDIATANANKQNQAIVSGSRTRYSGGIV